jgi:hypothetical protein
MAFEALLHEIDTQISCLQQAKALLSGTEAKRGPGRPTTVASPTKAARPKAVLSAKARKAIGDAQRARWAKVKAAAKAAKKS